MTFGYRAYFLAQSAQYAHYGVPTTADQSIAITDTIVAPNIVAAAAVRARGYLLIEIQPLRQPWKLVATVRRWFRL